MSTETSRLFNSVLAASAISAAFELGLLDRIERDGTLAISTYCAEHGLHEASIQAVFNALRCFSIVEFQDASRIITKGDQFRSVYNEKGYFLWLIRGYGYMLQNLASLVMLENRPTDSDDRTFVQRDGKYIAMAGRDYGAQFVDAHFDSVLNEQPFTVAADLGCGSAGRLIELALKYPEFRGVGVDVNAQAVMYAQENVKKAGLENRVTVVEGNVVQLGSRPEFADVTVLFCFFMGHDLWPRARCKKILQNLPLAFPSVQRFLLSDTYRSDTQPSPIIPTFTLGFEFTHAVMGQYIPTEGEWLELFDEAGWRCAGSRKIDIPFSAIFDLRLEPRIES